MPTSDVAISAGAGRSCGERRRRVPVDCSERVRHGTGGVEDPTGGRFVVASGDGEDAELVYHREADHLYLSAHRGPGGDARPRHRRRAGPRRHRGRRGGGLVVVLGAPSRRWLGGQPPTPALGVRSTGPPSRQLRRSEPFRAGYSAVGTREFHRGDRPRVGVTLLVLSRREPKEHPDEVHDRSRPRSVRRVGELGPGHPCAHESRPPRHRPVPPRPPQSSPRPTRYEGWPATPPASPTSSARSTDPSCSSATPTAER